MMKDHKNQKPPKRKDYTYIFNQLTIFCKKHKITFPDIEWLGVWIPGEYIMKSYGKAYHSNLKDFHK